MTKSLVLSSLLSRASSHVGHFSPVKRKPKRKIESEGSFAPSLLRSVAIAIAVIEGGSVHRAGIQDGDRESDSEQVSDPATFIQKPRLKSRRRIFGTSEAGIRVGGVTACSS